MIKVLLIDDDRRHSELLSTYCQRFEIEVDSAFDGEQGLRRLATTRPDLVLLDLMLPDGRGVAFLKALRARGEVTPVIILTAMDQVSDRISQWAQNAQPEAFQQQTLGVIGDFLAVEPFVAVVLGHPDPRLGP